MRIIDNCRQIHPNFDGRTTKSSSNKSNNYRNNKDNHLCLKYARIGNLSYLRRKFNKTRVFISWERIFIIASRNNHINIVKFLIDKGIDVNDAEFNTTTFYAVKRACEQNSKDTLQFLIDIIDPSFFKENDHLIKEKMHKKHRHQLLNYLL